MAEEDHRPHSAGPLREGLSASQKPVEVVVDGTDGAGKTTCIAALRAQLRDRGYVTATHAPYREVEVYALWETDPERAADAITEVMERCRSEVGRADVLLWDRGWPTAFVSTTHLGALERFLPPPPITILLLASQAKTREKAAREPKGPWVEQERLIERYNTAFHALGELAGTRLLRFWPNGAGQFDFEAIGSALELALGRVYSERRDA